MPQVLQSLVFMLKPGHSQPFLEWSRRAFDQFLCAQEGFLGWEVLQAQDGRWFLMLRWQDPPSAASADEAWKNHPLRRELDALVRPGSLTSTRMLSLRFEEPEDTFIRH